MEREIFRVLRDRGNLTNYKIAKRLGISESQLRYQEKVSESIQKKVIKRLFELASECGISADECAKLL